MFPSLLPDDDPHTEALVSSAQAGDEIAYENLIARVQDRVFVYICARLGPELRARIEPQDLLQDTLISAHRSFENFKDRGQNAFCGWLCRIADNRIRDASSHFKAKKRSAPKGLVRDEAVLAGVARGGPTPVSMAALSEREQRLIEALGELEEGEREVMLMHFYQGLSLGQIAEQRGETKSKIQRQVQRATLSLGRQLGA